MANPTPPTARRARRAPSPTPRGFWVAKQFFPPYEIRFKKITADNRMWFDELLISLFYYDVDILRQFSEIMNNWIVKTEAGKMDQVAILLKDKWEAKVAFNYLMGGDEDLLLAITKEEKKRKTGAFCSKIRAKYTQADEKLRRVLSYVVEKRAVDCKNYKYVLYAFYVFRTEQIPRKGLAPGDEEIFRYVEAVGAFDENTKHSVKRGKFSAKVLFYRLFREFVIKHYTNKLNPEVEDWDQLNKLAIGGRGVEITLPKRTRFSDHIDLGEFTITPEDHVGEDTPFQTLMGGVCKILKPNCMASLMDFKNYLLHIYPLARIAVYIGRYLGFNNL